MSFIEWIRVVFYGIVEGITEWLPVSSTGHLILFESFWPMQVSDDFLRMFRVVIQLGAILAVCVLYFDRLNPFSKKHSGSQKQEIWQIWVKVIIGCIPAGVLGILLDDFLDAHFYKWQVVAATLILYGIAFILLEIRNRSVRPKIRSFRQMSYGTAFAIGLFQVLSLIPGTSRSAFIYRTGDSVPVNRHGGCVRGIVDCYPLPDGFHQALQFPDLRILPDYSRYSGYYRSAGVSGTVAVNS